MLAESAGVGGVVGAIVSACLMAGGLLLVLHRKRKVKQDAAKADAEATPVRAKCNHEAAEKECTFWWVDARALRECKDVTLPKLQVLCKRDGFLYKKKITRRNSVQGAYIAEYLTISHRWLGGFDQPPSWTPSESTFLSILTSNGSGLSAYRVLCSNLSIPHHDCCPNCRRSPFLCSCAGHRCSYWSMPQGKRSVAESVEFKHMLNHANLLYLGTRVLVLLDLSYIGRFWTLFEAWLSMQTAHPEGLKPSTSKEQRFDIVPIHGANKITGESLKIMWAEKTPHEAHELLKEPDVTVTNQSDKEIQLGKLKQLDEEVREAMRATGMAVNGGKVVLEVAGTQAADRPVAEETNGKLAGLSTSHQEGGWLADSIGQVSRRLSVSLGLVSHTEDLCPIDDNISATRVTHGALLSELSIESNRAYGAPISQRNGPWSLHEA